MLPFHIWSFVDNVENCLAGPRIDAWYDNSFKEYKIVVPENPDDDTWEVPSSGLLEFGFASILAVENAKEINVKEIEWLHNELKMRGKTERDRVGAIKSFCEGDNFLKFEQVSEILDILPDDSRALERCELVQQCFSRLTEPERAIELLQLLTIRERKEVERKLGVAAIMFTKNNATGKYKLDLGKRPEREVCLRLLAINTSQQELIRSINANYSTHKGGTRHIIERSWRNAKFDDKPHVFSSTWAVPKKGHLEVDFVQVFKPTSAHNLTTDKEFSALERRLNRITVEERLVAVRDWFNRKVCLCAQVEQLMSSFKIDRDRVELLVIAYARVLDWHGYTNLLSVLSVDQHNMLIKRLGFVNLFNEVLSFQVVLSQKCACLI